MILSRYISKTIISAILLISLILIGIELFIAFINEINNIGTGNYNSTQALIYVLLDMPYQLSSLFPMAGLVGSLLGLGVLASQSELIVMRAAGFSTGQISFAVLKAAFLIVILALLFGEVIAPYTENLATTNKAIAKSAGQAVTTVEGTWLRVSNNFIHINNVLSTDHLLGVAAYKFDQQHHLHQAFFAKKADFLHHRWILTDVEQTGLQANTVTSSKLNKMLWNIRLNPNVLDIADSDQRNMSLLQLHTFIDYLKQNGLRATNYQLSYWKRIMQPISTAVMIFLAVPFIFGPLRTVTMGLRVVAGLSVGFFFYILNQFFGPLSALYQLPPFLGAVLPTLVFALAGFWLLWRAK